MSTGLRRLAHSLAALAGTFTGALIVTALALAGFSSGSTATHTVQTKRIFLGSRTVDMRDYADQSSGSAVSGDDVLSYPDALIKTTGNWANTFSSSRYFQLNFNSPLPAGVPVSAATFDFRMIPNAGSETASYYFEVRRISDDSLLGTHFSSGSPQTVTGTTYTTISTSLSEVTSSDIANDMYVKVFGKSSAAHAFKIDMATVTLTEFSTTETLFQQVYTDASTGTGTSTTWAFDSADSNTFTNASNWPTTFSATKYLNFTFPATVPTGAVVTGATFTHAYKSANGTDNICHYIEVYSSTTLLAAHGSSGSPYSCNSTGSFATDNISAPEVDTVAEANSVVVRVYVKDVTGTRKSIDDVDTLTLTYYLD